MPAMVTAQARDHGIVDIVIDEQGRVIKITMRQSVHPIYDNLLMSAARDWQYEPALFDGVPVKYRKLIQININKREE
jgi:TonB family protein